MRHNRTSRQRSEAVDKLPSFYFSSAWKFAAFPISSFIRCILISIICRCKVHLLSNGRRPNRELNFCSKFRTVSKGGRGMNWNDMAPGGGSSPFLIFVYRHLTYEGNEPMVYFSSHVHARGLVLTSRCHVCSYFEEGIENKRMSKNGCVISWQLGRFMHDLESSKRLSWRIVFDIFCGPCAHLGHISLLWIFAKGSSPTASRLVVCLSQYGTLLPASFPNGPAVRWGDLVVQANRNRS